MDPYPEVGDLRLVLAIARHGSVGAAARELLVAQPSASQRLAALERRCGVRLFERSTTGARPTAAGQAMVAEARHILGHLEGTFSRTRSAARSDSTSAGTIASLAMLVFPTLHTALPQLHVSQVVGHGPMLVDLVAEGSLDAAFVAIAGQMELPKGVASRLVGLDRISVLVPTGCDLTSTDRRQLARRTVVTYTIDYSGEELDRRLVALGATPHRAATAETAVRLGRLMGCPVALPRSLLRAYLVDGEREIATTRFAGPRLSLVTRLPAAEHWVGVVPAVRRELGLGGP
ncbi:MAG TPA: LysR family transcriptional regulator [Nocardioidaceae bacterium]|nr:LysR family transcriptional regulator [Nocardioidaceae bacterium]